MSDPFRGNDARYRRVFAPYIPVEDGGLMPAGQREAMRNAMARTLAAQPPSKNIEDRTKPGWEQRYPAAAPPTPPAPSRGVIMDWLMRGQPGGGVYRAQPFADPGELGAEAGYWDIERRPR